MLLQPTFDPTNPSSGQFNLNLTGGYGKAVLYNESNSNLKLTFSNNFTDYLPAWTAIELCFINIPLTNPIVNYSTLSTLSGIVASPISQVAIVTYEASEHVPGTYPAALVRSLSIGNQVNSTTTTNQVTNDGNPTVTTFIESTQSGNASGSNVAMGNDGSFTFAQFVSAVYTNLFQLIPGASPLLRLGTKLVVEAVDNSGANVSNIFGVDSSGNTFLQNHKTNNQTVIYDKNGVSLITVYANGDISHGTRFLSSPFHLTTSPTVTSGTTSTLTCTGGATGVPTTATGVIIGGGVSSGTAGAFVTLAPTGKTLGQYGGWTCQNASNQLEEFVMTIPISSGGQLDVHANSGNIVLQDWYIIGYIV